MEVGAGKIVNGGGRESGQSRESSGSLESRRGAGEVFGAGKRSEGQLRGRRAGESSAGKESHWRGRRVIGSLGSLSAA